MSDRTYKAEIDFATDPATIACSCDGCDWKGTADKLEEIDGCSLTPGHASPAGRCPECDALAYVDQPDTDRLLNVIATLRARLAGWVEIADEEDKREMDDVALDEADGILREAGRLT